MFEKLIERRMPKSIGHETLTPTSGETWCPIISGSFGYTYDGSTTSQCGFNPSVGTCLCMWYWDTPVNLMAIQLFTNNYHMKGVHELYMIQGRVNGSWVVLSTVRTNLNNNAWHTLNVTCENCTGIMIALEHSTTTHIPRIREVRILYETPPPPEGEAEITAVKYPDVFEPNKAFVIQVSFKNIGGDDYFFARVINSDTGKNLSEERVHLVAGTSYTTAHYITLSQTTAFHGLIEVGHEESISTREFSISPGGYRHV